METLSPDYDLRFHVICAIIGISACLLLHAINYPMYLLAQKLDHNKVANYAFEVLANMLATVAGLLLWVAVWQILKEDVLEATVWKGFLFHFIGVCYTCCTCTSFMFKYNVATGPGLRCGLPMPYMYIYVEFNGIVLTGK